VKALLAAFTFLLAWSPKYSAAKRWGLLTILLAALSAAQEFILAQFVELRPADFVLIGVLANLLWAALLYPFFERRRRRQASALAGHPEFSSDERRRIDERGRKPWQPGDN